MKNKKKIFLGCLLATVAVGTFVGWNVVRNRSFEETFYSISTPKLQTSVRVVMISDLHQLKFGEDNETLCSRVAALEPDFIVVAGDLLERRSPDPAFVVGFCRKLVGIAPVYFGLGNHENHYVYGNDLVLGFLKWKPELVPGTMVDLHSIEINPLLEELSSIGVHVLQNSMETIEINGEQIEIGGISTNVNSFWDYSGQFIWYWAENGSGNFKLLICHRPEIVMQYIPDYPFDLVLAGHLHGGGWRLPGVGGLFGSERELFPKYDAGQYQSGDLTMIVGRGFAGSGFIPRILNKPELVIVDIN